MPANSFLPSAAGLDIAALSQLFSNATNSYKFIFFGSLLDLLRRREFNAASPISFHELTVEMLANSWYPHNYFRLSFGLQDKLAAKLDALELNIGRPVLKFKDSDKKLLREIIARQNPDDSLLHYVPFRLLRPFFAAELRGLADYKADAMIARLANEQFTSRRPLYRFNADQDQIIVHPAWAQYLKAHYSIIKGWSAWHWLQYMQARNQGVPAVSAKLFPPLGRDSLAKQREYWRMVLRHSQLKCIYSGLPLNASAISLDHYLPWTFVAHDQLWNLIPTVPQINSAKSDQLPANIYFDRFVTAQHQGLLITSQHIESRKWDSLVEPYLADLKLGQTRDLLDHAKLRRAYKSTVLPLLELARTTGFSPGWVYLPASR